MPYQLHQFLGAVYNQVYLDFEVIHAFNSLYLLAHPAVLNFEIVFDITDY